MVEGKGRIFTLSLFYIEVCDKGLDIVALKGYGKMLLS